MFLLRPVCGRLGVSLIATEVDPASGRFSGRNCSGEEKVRRFRREYPDGNIDEFYTDSKKDLPLAAIAGRAYLVRKNKIREMLTEIYSNQLDTESMDFSDVDSKDGTGE